MSNRGKNRGMWRSPCPLLCGLPSVSVQLSQARREPRHVSEEPELVEEVAEPGAQDGAGAEVRVEEPWEGYRRMSAKEVIARLGNASAAELTAVGLYENGNQGRQTVLSAVERGLRTANRSS